MFTILPVFNSYLWDKDMVRLFYIALLVFLGSMLKPLDTYACEESKQKATNFLSTDLKKSLFKTDKCSEYGLQVHDGDCAGKCGNSACHCPTIFSGFTLPEVLEYSNTKITVNQCEFYYAESYLSWGFNPIWLPPKKD